MPKVWFRIMVFDPKVVQNFKVSNVFSLRCFLGKNKLNKISTFGHCTPLELNLENFFISSKFISLISLISMVTIRKPERGWFNLGLNIVVETMALLSMTLCDTLLTRCTIVCMFNKVVYRNPGHDFHKLSSRLTRVLNWAATLNRARLIGFLGLELPTWDRIQGTCWKLMIL